MAGRGPASSRQPLCYKRASKGNRVSGEPVTRMSPLLSGPVLPFVVLVSNHVLDFGSVHDLQDLLNLPRDHRHTAQRRELQNCQ